ncbi:MAG: hypothetical protein H0T87_15160 [Gammaproteobacteria bacterium]|nr:hypothetical protein [Gammaproteobacteria bacterium]
MSEYHKIETLYERDDRTHRLKQPLVLKNRVYGLVNPWVFSEKIDGTNIRAIWQFGKVVFSGRTDNAQIHADLFRWLYEHITPALLRAAFPSQPEAHAVVLYGEGYGAGIQKGGGDYSPEKRLILFDVAVRDQCAHDWWLSDENVRDVGAKLRLDLVPLIGEMTLAEATEMVREGFPSKIGTAGRPAEGLVGRPAEALFDKKGHRLIVKLKTKDF